MSNVTKVQRLFKGMYGSTAFERAFEPVTEKAYMVGTGVSELTTDAPIYPGVVNLSDYDCWRLYKGNDWIQATVDRIVNDCVKVKPRIVPKVKDRKVSVKLKKRIQIIQDFLDNPNDQKESFNDLREKLIRDALLYGRFALEKVLNPSRALKQLYSADVTLIKLRADKYGRLPDQNAYKMVDPYGRKGEVYFDIDELIHGVLKPCSQSLYGTKTLDGIANSVASDILRNTFNSRFFLNGAEAAGILGLEGMSDQKLQKFKEYWKNTFKGVDKAHKMAAVNVPIKYVRMALTNRDLQFSEYGIELRTKIFGNYGMQPFIMGIVDSATGKLNSYQQMELYKDGALRPILKKEAFYYTSEIIKMGFGFKDIELEFTSIDNVDLQTQSEIDINEAGAALVTVNELRARRELSPVPWGDTPVSTMPGGGQIDPKSGKLIPPSKTTAGSKTSTKKFYKNFIRFCMTKVMILETISFDIKTLDKRSLKKMFSIKKSKYTKTGLYSIVKNKIIGIVLNNISKGTLKNSLVEIDIFYKRLGVK